ncbi:hypothetical protein C8F01DRAFT_1369991 [Mycena amicta]|nr:hypothetical protein C8F01DRAFT_1369991 [Mycena amicta]
MAIATTTFYRLRLRVLLDLHLGDLSSLRAYETSIETLDLPVIPPVQLLQLHLSTFNEEDIAVVQHALPLYAGTLETLNVIMDGIPDIELAFLLDHLAAALPNLRQLRVCPPSGDHEPANLTEGGPYSGEPFNAIFSALARFTALDSLVLQLRSEISFEFFDFNPSDPEEDSDADDDADEKRSYWLGYPEELRWMALDYKPKDYEAKYTIIPQDERDFGCEIMRACPTLRRLELGIETYSTSSTDSDGPASYTFTRTEGKDGTVDVKRYRQKNWEWNAKEDFDAWV